MPVSAKTDRQTEISYERTYLHLSTVSYGTLYLLLIGKDIAASLGGAARMTPLPSRVKGRGRRACSAGAVVRDRDMDSGDGCSAASR